MQRSLLAKGGHIGESVEKEWDEICHDVRVHPNHGNELPNLALPTLVLPDIAEVQVVKD